MKNKRNLADDLRAVIRGREISAYKLAKQIGVGHTLISRFLRGKNMGVENASKIAAHLGLTLEPRFTKIVVGQTNPQIEKVELRLVATKSKSKRKRASK